MAKADKRRITLVEKDALRRLCRVSRRDGINTA